MHGTLYPRPFTVHIIRGHRDNGRHATKERGFLLGATPGHGEEFFLSVYGLDFCYFFVFFFFLGVCSAAFSHYEAVKTTLASSDCAVPKAAAQHLALAHCSHEFFISQLSFTVTCLVFLLQMTNIALITPEHLLLNKRGYILIHPVNIYFGHTLFLM